MQTLIYRQVLNQMWVYVQFCCLLTNNMGVEKYLNNNFPSRRSHIASGSQTQKKKWSLPVVVNGYTDQDLILSHPDRGAVFLGTRSSSQTSNMDIYPRTGACFGHPPPSPSPPTPPAFPSFTMFPFTRTTTLMCLAKSLIDIHSPLLTHLQLFPVSLSQ